MNIDLLPNQEKIYQDIITKMNDKNIVISGPSGCGKTEILMRLYAQAKYLGYAPFFLDSGKLISVDQYYPFLSGLNEEIGKPSFTQFSLSLSQDSPFLPHTTEFIHKWIRGKVKKNLNFLSETEKAIFDRLSFLSKKKKILLLCDNIQYWDSCSLRFFNSLFQNQYLRCTTQKITFICSFTSDQKSTSTDFLSFLWCNNEFEVITFGEISYSAFVNNLYCLGLQKDLERNEFEILFHLAQNHIQLMLEIIKEVNGNRLNFDVIYQSNIDFLKPILIDRLKKLGALGSFIDEALKYASLMGIKFDKIELSQIIEKNIESSLDFYGVLKEAENIHLVKEYDQINYTFVHEIILKVFETEISDFYKPVYYLKLAECLRCIKPHDYLRRAYCLVNSHRAWEAERIFSLYLIQQFKEKSELSEVTYNELKSHINTLDSYITSMMHAYLQYHQKDYTGAYLILFGIPDIYSNDLLAEKYILVSCCLTKNIETVSKKEAIHCLSKYMSLEKVNGELDIYENVLERLIICYTHFGDIRNARNLEEKFVLSIAKRIDYDSYAKYRLYKLYRKSNALYSAELALIKMQQSVSFFATENMLSNIKDLYIALTNLSCVLLETGEFEQAYIIALKGINLESEYPHLSFSRTQIIRSNFCIASILVKKIKLQEGINIITNILETMPIIPERIFHITNLTTLYAMNGKISQALEILEEESEKQNYENDIEGLYKYYIYYNRIVFNFLLNRTFFLEQYMEELINMEEKLLSMLDGNYLVEKNKQLIQIIRNKSSDLVYHSDEWLHVFHNKKTIYKNKSMWKYHGLGFAFVSMNNWE